VSEKLTVCFVSAIISTPSAYIEYTNEIDDHFEFFDKIYDKPWTRFGPYLVGMLVGYYLFKTNFKIQMSKVLTAFRAIAKKSFNTFSYTGSSHRWLDYCNLNIVRSGLWSLSV
jgi:hypothetical protein